jgi:hypothetical protein
MKKPATRPTCDGCDWHSKDANADSHGLKWERHLCWRDSGCPSVRDEVLDGKPAPLACCDRFPTG